LEGDRDERRERSGGIVVKVGAGDCFSDREGKGKPWSLWDETKHGEISFIVAGGRIGEDGVEIPHLTTKIENASLLLEGMMRGKKKRREEKTNLGESVEMISHVDRHDAIFDGGGRIVGEPAGIKGRKELVESEVVSVPLDEALVGLERGSDVDVLERFGRVRNETIPPIDRRRDMGLSSITDELASADLSVANGLGDVDAELVDNTNLNPTSAFLASDFMKFGSDPKAQVLAMARIAVGG
jgi:hypothetical protein